MKICCSVLLWFCFTTNAAFAQEINKELPIDRAYRECIQVHNSALGMSNCAFEAYKKWDADLNKYYNRLVKTLKKPADVSSLKKSEQAWLLFRDAEFNAYNNMFNRTGDRWTEIRMESRIALVRARVLQLQAYTDSLQKK